MGLVTGETQETLSQHVQPDLRRRGVPVYGASSSYVALPEPAIEQLLPVWAANRYRPKRGDDDELPAALGLPSPVYRVPGYHVLKRRLVHALADGLQDRMVDGALARTADGYQVRLREPPEALDVQAGAVPARSPAGRR